MKRILECVPNFSEGRNMDIIKQITDQIESIDGVKLLDVDPGKATNRTVVTFVGEPGPVVEAAFQAIKKAAELIDMSRHQGEHPRMGATDVCPFIPISGITMEEAVEYARILGKRVGEELGIPIYCYEFAAFSENRKNLANCRSGEYEGLKDKLGKPGWKPDFGPSIFNAKAGATAIGARNFLVAYNINLNTTSTRRANAIAFDVREAGRPKRTGDTIAGDVVKDKAGNTIRIPGTLKKTKAIGWYIEEYGIAQISMNLTDITVTPVHVAFDEVCKKAEERGIRVTGSELVGLIPLQAMLDAGKYFLKKQKRSLGISEDEIIKIAVKSLGLDELRPFNPKEKIIEYQLEDAEKHPLRNITLSHFSDLTSSESPAPGGGSISAYAATLGVALGTMVANLSSHKRGWDDRWQEFSDWAERGQLIKKQLMILVDEDTNAFNGIMAAMSLPKSTESERKLRNKTIQEATIYAIEVPCRVIELCQDAMPVIKTMADIGNPNSVTDAGVGALMCSAAASGAFLNVKVNLSGLDDRSMVIDYLDKYSSKEKEVKKWEEEILEIVEARLNS